MRRLIALSPHVPRARDGCSTRAASRYPALPIVAPITLAIGPEGGLEPSERSELLGAGFVPVTLAPLTLRFDTAAIASLGIVRAALSAATERVRCLTTACSAASFAARSR